MSLRCSQACSMEGPVIPSSPCCFCDQQDASRHLSSVNMMRIYNLHAMATEAVNSGSITTQSYCITTSLL